VLISSPLVRRSETSSISSSSLRRRSEAASNSSSSLGTDLLGTDLGTDLGPGFLANLAGALNSAGTEESDSEDLDSDSEDSDSDDSEDSEVELGFFFLRNSRCRAGPISIPNLSSTLM
jgi:hypothetical protein